MPDSNTLPKYKKDNMHWVVEPDQERTPLISARGLASKAPITVHGLFEKAVKKAPSSVAFKWENKLSNGQYEWKSMTYKDYFEASKRAARSLIKLGVQKNSGVAIIGFNRPEWLIAHMGAIFCGGLSAGIYTTNQPESCKYIVNHSRSVVVVCEDFVQLKKFASFAENGELQTVKAFVVYGESSVTEFVKEKKYTADVYSWSEFLHLGNGEDAVLEQRLAYQKPAHACTLIYTSGTTGPPKAVMLSHDNVTWTGNLIKSIDQHWGEVPETLISYLPLSHVAAQLADIYFPICTTANHKGHATLYFARSDALKGSLKITLQAARPTLFFGVPRVWEKFMEQMVAIGKSRSPFQQKIAAYAKAVGKSNWDAVQTFGYEYRAPLSYYFFKFLVFDKIKKNLGFDRTRIFLTGAAPISLDVLSYFGSLDIHIHNIFGMSETTGPFTATRPGNFKAGTCGAPLEGLEVKINHVEGRDKLDEGEICFRGRSVMLGYFREPAKTKEVIDDEGYLHSGDVGSVDKVTGSISITGRIKELLITAGGENVAPVPIEEAILKLLPALSNVMVIGDRKKFLSALITLKVSIDEKTGMPTQTLTGAALTVSSAKTVLEAKNEPAWKKYIEDGIKKYNQVSVSSAQKVQKFEILEQDFSLGGGELTDTLKLKRSVVTKMYEDLIEKIYSSSDE
jgi:long-chain-fatty-acid--CoA ligase ACSBG